MMIGESDNRQLFLSILPDEESNIGRSMMVGENDNRKLVSSTLPDEESNI